MNGVHPVFTLPLLLVWSKPFLGKNVCLKVFFYIVQQPLANFVCQPFSAVQIVNRGFIRDSVLETVEVEPLNHSPVNMWTVKSKQ